MADEPRGKEFDVTPEEARFLRRFVRRTVLPWIAGVCALSGLALGVALSVPPPSVLVAPEPDAPAAPAAPAASDELRAASDELRAQLATLRADLAALRSRADAPAPVVAEASPAELATIRDRLYDLERAIQSQAADREGSRETSDPRVERLELRVSELEGRSASPASPEPR